MSSDSWVLKVEKDGDLRRLRDFACDPGRTSLEEVQEAVGRAYGLGAGEGRAITLKYRDGDGDLCTLCDATLPDALALGADSRSLRLVVSGPTGREQLPEVAPGEDAAPVATPPEASPLSDLFSDRLHRFRGRITERVEEVRASRQFQAGSDRIRTAAREDAARLECLREQLRAGASRVSDGVEEVRASHGNAAAAVGVAGTAALATPVALCALSLAHAAVCVRVVTVAGGAIVAAARAEHAEDAAEAAPAAAAPGKAS